MSMQGEPSGDILLAGGYGVVGRRIAARLAPLFPGRLVIAGRNESRAAAACHELGHGTRSLKLDVEDPASTAAALNGICTVVACVAQRHSHLLRQSIGRGLRYTDISPRLAFWRGADEMGAEAQRTGARILLGAGLSPGISNMMAARLADAVGNVERIETAILLSIGDEYGPDSMQHVFESVSQPFSLLEDSQPRTARPFSEPERVDFPEPLGQRRAYVFPWSDVVFYPKTLGASTAIGRFALDPPWVGNFASWIARAGVRGWLQRPGFLQGNRHAMDRVKRLYTGRDRFALVVTTRSRERTMRMSLAGRHQADATAAGAAELARALVRDEVREPGVWLPEQVISHDRFFAALAQRGFKPTMEEIRHGPQQSKRRGGSDVDRHNAFGSGITDPSLQRPADRGPRL